MWLKFVVGAVLIYSVIAGPHCDVEEISPFAPSDPEGYSFRLPNNSIPLSYEILLSTAVHEGDFNFNGTVMIRLRTLMASNNITINFKQLSINEVHLFDENSIIIQNYVNFETDNFTELLVIRPQFELLANHEYVIQVEYNGVMRTDSYGYYRGSYVNELGITRWFGTTQFHATDARHAFPRWDFLP